MRLKSIFKTISKNEWLAISGVLVHFVFLLSIFDIYFKSPIIHGIDLQENSIQPLAKRLVLFVADGLRADSFFSLSDGSYKSPYLRSVLEKRGVWGVSHCRVPTESRPGHVALIAGFYEDPSAVFKGWKENPVDFDSVFNQSSVTFSWGSPDILPMFSKGATEGRVNIDTYPAEDEDFSGRNSSVHLNSWVFEKVETFLDDAKTNSPLKELLNKGGVVLFLHLLGPDVSGHVNKPHSKEYEENIRCVDKGVQTIEQLVMDFYDNDNKTAFIFTSDHGMTDWGSHGDGSPSETETPIVVWGAGIETPHETEKQKNAYVPSNWRLDHLQRRDIRQADLVPLMSILLGISIPVHSLGSLPLEYLKTDDKTSAEAMYLNSKQLISQFRRHRQTVEENSLKWLYKPFQDLTFERETMYHENIKAFINNGLYKEAIEESRILIRLSLSGLKYYQNYYQYLLLFSISLSYIGWIVWLAIQVLQQSQQPYYSRKAPDSKISRIDVFFTIFLCITLALIFVQSFPAQYYIYCCLPVILWWAVFKNHTVFSSISLYMNNNFLGTVVTLSLYALGIELLVLTFFYRWTLCLVLCGLGVWPFIDKLPKQRPLHKAIWFLSCCGLAIFPTLPTVGTSPNTKLVIISGWLWLVAGIILIASEVKYLRNVENRLLLAFQLSLFPITVWLVSSTAVSYESKQGLPLLNQLLSWILLVTCPLAPLIGSSKFISRLGTINLSLAVPFLLLSTGHEAFFLLILSANLFIWLLLENDYCKAEDKDVCRNTFVIPNGKVNKYLNEGDFRRAFFFLVYIILSFFGTGNIASINSFDPVWVRCFVSVFSPFTMTILILLKILVPFLLVSCTFHALLTLTKAQTNQLFLIILILSDVMGLHFLYAVTNEGSWLQIGTSISHYVIMQSVILFIVVLYSIACFYMNFSLPIVLLVSRNLPPTQSLESRAKPKYS